MTTDVTTDDLLRMYGRKAVEVEVLTAQVNHFRALAEHSDAEVTRLRAEVDVTNAQLAEACRTIQSAQIKTSKKRTTGAK